jgi:hypothetical protein
MDNSHLNLESGGHQQVDMKRSLLRLAAFFLLFFASRWLLKWLHPVGINNFLLISGLLAVGSWILVGLLLPRRTGDLQ